MAIFSDADRAFLRRPHIVRAWFGFFDLPSGEAWLHNGVGNVTVNGQEYRGVTDPLGGQLVHISAIDDPRFGQAAKVDIIIGGVNVEFFKSVKQDARALEGRVARLSWAMFDPETGEMLLMKRMLPGRITSPSLHRRGISERYIGLSIEGFWQAQNFPFGGRWTYADHMRKWPGDKGLMYVGQKVHEIWT